MQVRDANHNRRTILVLALVCFVLQVGLAPHIALGNGRINFALIFAAVVALTIGGGTGVFAGFLGGFVFDLSTTGPIGLMTLLCTVGAFSLGLEARNRLSDDPSGSVVAFSAVTFVVSLAYHLGMLLVGDAASFFDVLFLRTVPTFVLTVVAFLPFVWFFSRDSANLRRGGLSGGHYSLGKL